MLDDEKRRMPLYAMRRIQPHAHMHWDDEYDSSRDLAGNTFKILLVLLILGFIFELLLD